MDKENGCDLKDMTSVKEALNHLLWHASTAQSRISCHTKYRQIANCDCTIKLI